MKVNKTGQNQGVAIKNIVLIITLCTLPPSGPVMPFQVSELWS